MKLMVIQYKEQEQAKKQQETGPVEEPDSKEHAEHLRKMLKQDSVDEVSPERDRWERNTTQLLAEENIDMYEISAGIKDNVRGGDYLLSSMGEREKNELLLKAQSGMKSSLVKASNCRSSNSSLIA